MDFPSFLEFVPHIIAAELPAAAAHAKMAPLERMEELENIDFTAKKTKTAAVMMLLYPKNGLTHLVLIVRNLYEGVHSGQIAFPGGKYEEGDSDFAETALRETHEEVGVHPDFMEIKKDFTPIYIPPSNFLVYPFMGISTSEIIFVPDPSEVDRIIELPLSVFLNDDILVKVRISTSYATDIEVPAFEIEGQTVWGATAMMLSELKDVLITVM